MARQLYTELLSSVMQHPPLREFLLDFLCKHACSFDPLDEQQNWVLPAINDLLNAIYTIDIAGKER